MAPPGGMKAGAASGDSYRRNGVSGHRGTPALLCFPGQAPVRWTFGALLGGQGRTQEGHRSAAPPPDGGAQVWAARLRVGLEQGPAAWGPSHERLGRTLPYSNMR